MFYSKSTNGFYDPATHGARTIKIIDPLRWRPEDDALGVDAPTIEIDNPDCKIPVDAVEITTAYYATLLDGQSVGQRIVSGENGLPVLTDQLPLTAEQRIAAGIAAVQLHMDDAARSLGYDDIKSAVTYADEPAVAKFQQEGRALRAWRSLVWESFNAAVAGAQSEAAPVPAAADIVAALPAFSM